MNSAGFELANFGYYYYYYFIIIITTATTIIIIVTTTAAGPSSFNTVSGRECYWYWYCLLKILHGQTKEEEKLSRGLLPVHVFYIPL